MPESISQSPLSTLQSSVESLIGAQDEMNCNAKQRPHTKATTISFTMACCCATILLVREGSTHTTC